MPNLKDLLGGAKDKIDDIVDMGTDKVKDIAHDKFGKISAVDTAIDKLGDTVGDKIEDTLDGFTGDSNKD